MGAAMSLDITKERIEVAIRPKLRYTPTILSIRGRTDTVELHADDDQLAEIEFAIREYLQATGHHEVPDQQQILHSEHDLKEGIA